MQWYYVKNNERFGPVDEAELFRLAREGALSPDTLVWNPDMGDQWVPASSIPGLFGDPPQSSAPASTVPAAPPPLAADAGQTPNADLMARARASLSGQWAIAIGVSVLFQIVAGAGNFVPYLGVVAILVITGPMLVGWSRFFLNLSRGRPVEVGQLFDGFKLFGKSVGAYFLMSLFIGLWSLLTLVPALAGAVLIPMVNAAPDTAFIVGPLLLGLFMLCLVPAIRASIAYSQIFFILSDNPDVGAIEAIDLSKKMMDGYKWKYVCLGARFIGWICLSMLTCGIGLLWVAPYVMASYAHFYEDVRANA
jgi:uncharacterized membrane protein